LSHGHLIKRCSQPLPLRYVFDVYLGKRRNRLAAGDFVGQALRLPAIDLAGDAPALQCVFSCSLWLERNEMALFQSLQRGDAVIFLEGGGFSGDLSSVELDLLRVFFGFDFDEPAVERLFHCFGYVAQ
jgi:hypothetical protein